MAATRTPHPRERQPRQQRSEETRAQILAAAEQLFAREGYAGESLSMLAREIGIHKPGIFYYFPTKRALYEAVVKEALGSIEESTLALLASERAARDRILAAAANWVDTLADRPTLARLLLHEAANPDATNTPAVFAEVGQRLQLQIGDAMREIQPTAHEGDIYHYFSMLTGGTLFYASAMQPMMSAHSAPASVHSMEHHKKLLLGMTRDFLRRLKAA
ncbi:MAG: TetR/AcrR family transcriptional regulator [bacterium]|nr:TetR/AcrR family transcriptional regulator [bacterium]